MSSMFDDDFVPAPPAPKSAAMAKGKPMEQWMLDLIPLVIAKLFEGKAVEVVAIAELLGPGTSRNYTANVLGKGDTKHGRPGVGLYKHQTGLCKGWYKADQCNIKRAFARWKELHADLEDEGKALLLSALGMTKEQFDAAVAALPEHARETLTARQKSNAIIAHEQNMDGSGLNRQFGLGG